MTDASAGIRRSNPWLVLAILLAIYIVNFADRYLISGLVGPIKQEFGLGDTMLGILMGPAFVVLYVVAGVPIARLADRGSRIRIIVAGCLVWSMATAATGFATGAVSIALCRLAVGIGEAAFVAPAYSLITDYFRPERRGRAFAILGFATYLGQMLGQGGGPAIAAATHWRVSFWSIGALGVCLAIVALALVREPPRDVAGQGQPDARDDLTFAQLVTRLWASRAWVYSTGALSFGTISGVAFGYWAPELCARSFAIDPVTVKSAFAINFGMAGLFGTLLFGFLSDRLAQRGMHWPSLLAGLAMGSATIAILLATWAPSFAVVSLLAIPSGLLGGGWAVGVHATVQHVLPARIRASGTALYIAISSLVGQIAGPFSAGLMSDAMGGDAASLRLALSVVIPLGMVGALCAWLAARHAAADHAALATTPSTR